MKAMVLFLLTFLAFATNGVASEPEAIDPQAAHRMLQEEGSAVLLLDVRDPVEIQFVGQPTGVDANVPFLIADRTQWNPERGMLVMQRNPEFAEGVAKALEAKGLGRDATILTICRSGSERGRPSAAFLRAAGFPNARYVKNGFQGEVIAEGPQKGQRLQNGWQNSGLPWTPKPERLHIEAASPRSWLVILSSASEETQAMALILATAAMDAGAPVRILLCDEAGQLALRTAEPGGKKILPPDKSPRELLSALISRGAVVEVCGIFLPTRGIPADQLVEGVVPANPRAVAPAISSPNTTVLTF